MFHETRTARIPECLESEFPLLARLQKEYLHTPIWLEATCRSQTQNYGCDSDSILLVSGMPFSGDAPSQRHDGRPCSKDDPLQRKKWSGKPLQLQAMLTQI